MPKPGTSKIMWICGGAGHGKTTLTGSIVERLASEIEAPPVVHFFCTGEDESKRDPNSIARSWVGQLVNKLRSHGFDECGPPERPWFQVKKEFLTEFWKVAAASSIKILISSRSDADIYSHINSTAHGTISFSGYNIKPNDTSEDIKAYSTSIVLSGLKVNKDQAFLNEISEDAAEKCSVRATVSRMPKGLEQTYRWEIQLILSLEPEEKERAIAILRWTRRPLTIRKLAEALATEDNLDGCYPYDDIPEVLDEYYVNDQIRKYCQSLVYVRGESLETSMAAQTIHFIHSWVKDFLRQDPTGSLIKAISFPREMTEHGTLARPGRRKKINVFPFLRYAAWEWSSHLVRSGSCLADLEILVHKLFDPASFRWVIFWAVVQEWTGSVLSIIAVEPLDIPSPLYTASHLGLFSTVLWLLSSGVNINESHTVYGSAAAARSYWDIVHLLIEKGADVNLLGGELGFPIVIAGNLYSPGSSEHITKLLLQAGADVACHDQDGKTALHYFAINGSEETIFALLENGADIESLYQSGTTALFFAAACGHTKVVELLIEKGASVATANINGQTPLHVTTARGYHTIMELLLQHEADVDVVAKTGVTPLWLAVTGDDIDALTLLLRHGAI
ncbi:uncharacterized protein DSM5745_03080 [Aspergillus mulundensis]|uniref:Nephrocystin 3-like N-terminal domain-containing protein n=1 Tax=Aspergillus mulundensis TaxID=1810919 RepID=A0A3D8SKW7_9EURO|nr:hypothetical protein DSM5745_03080 [Aspergillus mulundensis]RDW86438.1 hypothetical protein DSM5745_03080 [Aspergillus mulundensis]